ARRLPDLPRWVEARSLLLWGPCEIFGLEEEAELSAVLRDPETGSVFVVGTPAMRHVQVAVRRNAHGGELVAPREQESRLAHAVPGWTHARAILHLLRDPTRLPAVSGGGVDFLDPALLAGLPLSVEFRRELESAAEHSLIAAMFVEGQPVSFCYAGSITESLWDISIDTLPEHRRRGHAARCVAHMIHHMRAEGKQPVWAALETNSASWRLAQKLGFTAVDELAIFAPP
ncbi:MAG TPA: GNAT family N-acetyltransferase, partial [Gemmatimonadaceae bacterium]|nr:GNAT family N-acetyltransferase [Gemmatimonadaceae bacterium]